MRISVVMPSYNQGQFLDASIRSLIEQDYADKELIFIDGGSTDETLEIFETYKDHFAHFVSEKDLGQSDALQKGFDRASGDVLTWLNTDDLLLPNALHQVRAEYEANPKIECVFGNVVWVDSDNQIMRCRKGGQVKPWLTKMGRLTPFGPSAFFKAEALRRVGGLNLDFHYSMDTELWWRFCLDGVKFSRLRDYTWAFRRYPESKTSGYLFNENKDYRNHPEYRREREHIAELKRGYCWPYTDTAGRILEVLKRATSAPYIESLIESRRYKGCDLSVLLD